VHNLLFLCYINLIEEFVMCCASRQAGHRIGEHLEKVIPLVVKFSRVEDDELREYCLQAFESFVRRCPKDISPHIPMVKLYSQSCLYTLDVVISHQLVIDALMIIIFLRAVLCASNCFSCY